MPSNEELLKELATPTRNRYFYSKLMDVFHFELEQLYGIRKRSLVNRLALGRGVLCGCPLAPTVDGKQVAVGRGVCIDALGREIVVPEQSRPVDPRQPTDDCGRPAGDRIVGAQVVHICLAYHECEAEPVPVLVGDCDSQAGCAPSVIRERFRLLVRSGAPPEIEPACGFPNVWDPPAPGTPSTMYAELVKRVSRPCAVPAGEQCVVLARINLPDGDAPITAAMIDMNVRPLVYSNDLLFELLLCLARQGAAGAPAPGPAALTTVTQLSWEHDKDLTLNKFMRNGLKVTFSDNIKATTERGEAWFVVTVEYPVTRFDGGRPALAPGTIFVQRVLAERIDVTGKTATFKPAEAFKESFANLLETLRDGVVVPLCRVVLKCNALTGLGDVAVDGDFRAGILPSGDGTAGGDFESWFTLSMR